MRLIAHRRGFAAVTEAGAVDLGVEDLAALIDGFDDLVIDASRATAVSELDLVSPVASAGKVVCVMRNRPDPLPFAYLKHPALGVGPGGVLPAVEPDLRFEAEIAAIVRGPARHVAAADWRRAVFGFTAFLDTARGPVEFPPGVVEENWEKSWDTPWAAGPGIVTADELGTPGLGLELTVDGGCHTDPGVPSIGELIAFLTSVMTLRSGDVIALGAHRDTVVPAHGAATVSIPEIGTLEVTVG